MIQGIHTMVEKKSAYTLKHEKVLIHYPQTFQGRMLLNSIFWKQNKGQFPRNLWESCLLVIVFILQGGEGTLKKVNSTWKSDMQDGKIIRKFGSVSSSNLLYNLGQPK